MNKVRFLTIATLILLLTNLALVSLLLFRRPPHPKEEGPKNLIIEKLNLDQNQTRDYEKLIQWHRSEIRNSEDEILMLKNRLYSGLATDTDSVQKDSLINELAKVQTKIENIHYKHFQDIKTLCHADQKKAFESLTREIAGLFNRTPERRDRK
jgi:hypothetical protein